MPSIPDVTKVMAGARAFALSQLPDLEGDTDLHAEFTRCGEISLMAGIDMIEQVDRVEWFTRELLGEVLGFDAHKFRQIACAASVEYFATLRAYAGVR